MRLQYLHALVSTGLDLALCCQTRLVFVEQSVVGDIPENQLTLLLYQKGLLNRFESDELLECLVTCSVNRAQLNILDPLQTRTLLF